MSSAREEILNKLKNAVHPKPERPDFDAPVYFPIEQALEVAFKENLEKVNGSVHLYNSETDLYRELKTLLAELPRELIVCNESELGKQLKQHHVPFTSTKNLPENLQVGITSCEFIIAHTGSVMVSSAQQGGRQLSVYPEIHVVIASDTQLVDYLEAAYNEIKNKYKENLPSQITLITGPSRTADIEKTLVMGAHGPREFHVFLLRSKVAETE
jgi:L-lactate dehydrogenase complex protein LldG